MTNSNGPSTKPRGTALVTGTETKKHSPRSEAHRIQESNLYYPGSNQIGPHILKMDNLGDTAVTDFPRLRVCCAFCFSNSSPVLCTSPQTAVQSNILLYKICFYNLTPLDFFNSMHLTLCQKIVQWVHSSIAQLNFINDFFPGD